MTLARGAAGEKHAAVAKKKGGAANGTPEVLEKRSVLRVGVRAMRYYSRQLRRRLLHGLAVKGEIEPVALDLLIDTQADDDVDDFQKDE